MNHYERISATKNLIGCPDTSDYDFLANWVREYIDPGNTLKNYSHAEMTSAIEEQIALNNEDLLWELSHLDVLNSVAYELATALQYQSMS